MKKKSVICAIDDYPTLTKLNCAVNDSDEMNVQLRSLGFDVLLLRNEQCTANNLTNALRNLARELEDGDTFVFYFAGHGVVSDDDDYYCMYNADDKMLKMPGNDVVSFLSMKGLTDRWAPGVKKGFIPDCCRHQANRAEAQNRSGPGKAFHSDPKNDIKPYLKAEIDPETTAVLLSCQTGQGAQELHSKKQGLLVSAFKEIAQDLKKLGKPLVLDAELVSKLGQGMNKLARQHNLNEQTPMLFPLGVNLRLGGGVEDDHDQHIRDALAEFEDHLAAGRLDKPYNRCCTSVMTKLLTLKLDEQQHEALADRLQTALDDREQQELAASDQQLFRAAEAVNTQESWGRYIEKCKLCQKEEQARAAIKRIQEEAQKSGDVAAQKIAEVQRRREEENRKAEALREQEAREEAEAERKKKAAEEAQLAKLAEEEIVRRKQAEAEQAKIAQAAQRADEARLTKEKQSQEEARRKREEAEATARREAMAKAEQEAKEAVERRAREEAEIKRQQDVVKRQQAEDEKAWQETIRLVEVCADLNNKKVAYESYANRWSLHRVEALARVGELKEKIRQAADVALEQEKEAQRLKAEQTEREASKRVAQIAAEKAEIEREKAVEAKRQQESEKREAVEQRARDEVKSEKREPEQFAKDRSAKETAGKTGDVKKGMPGWVWGLVIVVPLAAVGIGLNSGEKKQEAPNEINFAPQPISPPSAQNYAEAQSVQNSWAALPYGNPDRGRQLDRLLGLVNQLSPDEKNKLLASMGQHYQNTVRPSDGTVQSWMDETEKLAAAGIKPARFALGSALLSGKNPDTRRAGSLYSLVLQGVTAQTQHEDEKMTDAILNAVGKFALIADDRVFAEAITPGLTQLALLGAPDAAFYLANLMVCRANPPRLDDARNYLNIAAQSSKWNALALDRLKTVHHMELCDFTKQK